MDDMTSAPPVAKRRPLSARQRRRYVAMLELTLDLMERNGFDGVSVRELAELADITPTTIYNVFGSKEGLLSAAVEYRTRSFIRSGFENESGFDGLIAINQRMASTSVQSNQLIRSIATMLARDSTLFAVSQIYRTFHCRFIAEIQRDGDLSPLAKPNVLACLLMTSHNAALNFWAGSELAAEYLSVLFDIETCNILHPVAEGATARKIAQCYADRMAELADIDFDALLDRTPQLPTQFDMAELASPAPTAAWDSATT